MKFISICSGIEAASVAFGPLGWKAIAFSEIEPFPCAVLAHHYPDVPNFGDMTKFRDWPEDIFIEADAIVGGPPCQAFSVAGKRNGLNDDRGNLTLIYSELIDHADAIRIAHGKQPVIVLYENVPGLLSDKTNAFGCFLGALAGEDEALVAPRGKWSNAGCVSGPQRTLAWTVTDAQFFGVAQRRRRVFVVASARDGFNPAEVLFEPNRMRRDTPPRREAGQSTAHDVVPSLTASGRGVERIGETRGQDPVVAVPAEGCWWDGGQVAVAFDTTQVTSKANRSNPKPGDPCHPLAAGAHPPLIAFDSRQDPVSSEHVFGALGSSSPQAQAVCVTGEITHTLRAEGFDASEDGTGRGNPIVAQAVSLRGRDGGATAELGGDVSNCLRASSGGGDKPHVLAAMAVRRLTPVECERLQGFPDSYTDVPYRKKPAADGPRYKSLGNSWAVPNVRWIGERIDNALRGNA